MPCKNHPDLEEAFSRCSRCGEEFCGDCVVELKGRLYCARCKAEQVRDVLSGVDGTSPDLASVGRRFAALFIDNLLLGAAVQVVAVPLTVVAESVPGEFGKVAEIVGITVVMVFNLALPLIYEGLMLQARGQTLGKMAMQIKVVTPEGKDIASGQAWLRAAIRLVLGCTIIVDYIPAFFVADRRCIHDMAASTRVVNWRP